MARFKLLIGSMMCVESFGGVVCGNCEQLFPAKKGLRVKAVLLHNPHFRNLNNLSRTYD
jgi:hypothetical protein